MLSNFWEGIGKSVSEKWQRHFFGPPLIFWLIGTLAWARNQVPTDLLPDFLIETLSDLDLLEVGILIFGAMFLLTVSGNIVQSTTLPVLRFLEGYWPRPLAWLRKMRISTHTRTIESDENRWNALNRQGILTHADLQEFLGLEQKLHYIPDEPQAYMPTTLGNVLHSAETRPKHRYGLDAIVCWPRLWSVLPADVRDNLSETRNQIDTYVNLWTWSVLLVIWVFWDLWVLPVGFILAWFAYRQLIANAMVYADLLDAAFDLYRWEMYKALHMPLPDSPAEEIPFGDSVTEYLWRGENAALKFEHPDQK